MASRLISNYAKRSWLSGGPPSDELHRLQTVRRQSGTELARALPFARLIEMFPYDCKTEDEAASLGLAVHGLHNAVGDRHAGLRSGLTVDPEHVSKRGVVRANNRRKPEVFGCGAGLVVTRQARDIIEYFEPGKHQFLPFEIVFRDGGVLPDSSILVVRQILNAVSVEHSRLLAHEGQYKFTFYTIGPSSKLVVWRDVIAGHHLFYDARFSDLYLSDALTAELEPMLDPVYQFEPIVEL